VCSESKVIRLLSIIHNGIILDLVCGFGVVSVVVLVRMFVLIFPVEARNLFLFVGELPSEKSVILTVLSREAAACLQRDTCESDLDFPEVSAPLRERVWIHWSWSGCR